MISRMLSMFLGATLLLVVHPIDTLAVVTFDLEWGTQGSGPGQFDGPHALAIDGNGDVYVAGGDNGVVQKFNPNGVYIMTIGTTGNGIGQLQETQGIEINNATGRLYVSDIVNHKVVVFDKDTGVFVNEYGGLGSAAHLFNNPRGMIVDSSGDILVCDTSNSRVKRYNSLWQYQNNIWSFSQPTDIAEDAVTGTLYISITGNDHIRTMPGAGTIGTSGSSNGELLDPYGLVVHNSILYVADQQNHRIQCFSADGSYLGQWGSEGNGPSQFKFPKGIAAHGDFIYVADSNNHRIQRFSNLPQLHTPVETTSWGALKNREPKN